MFKSLNAETEVQYTDTNSHGFDAVIYQYQPDSTLRFSALSFYSRNTSAV